MKILNIHFKNINSLEGEHRIDFERPPFSDSGVFAITGPNGSGKSSILDAITLGLYGETFRFDRPSQHVMTQHTTECYSTIEFALDQEKYRSSWHVQRANLAADLTPPEMILTRLSDNEVLATTSPQVCARITEISGMNFRNFTRSILLAQGDFSAFLNALDNERLEILEKIISTDIYTDYKAEVIAKAADAQQRLDYLKQDLAIIPLMDIENLEACEHDLIDFIEQTSELREQQNSLTQQQTSLHNALALQSNIVGQEKELQKTKALSANEQKNVDQLATHQDALLFEADVRVIKEKNHELHQDKETLTGFQGELKHLQDLISTDNSVPDNSAPESLLDKSVADQDKMLTVLRAQAGQLTAQRQSESDLEHSLAIQIDEKTSGLATVSTWITEHEADKSLLSSFPETGRLKKIRSELSLLKEQQKAYAKWSKNTISALKNNQSAIEQENKQIATLKIKLPQVEKALTELAQGKNLAELEEFLQDQQQRVKDFKELLHLAKINQKLSQSGFSFFGIFGRKEQPDYDIESLEAELTALKQEISQEEHSKYTLDLAVFRESLLKKMAPERRHLVDNEPCFLCGEIDHPFAEHPPKIANSQQALTDQKAKIKALMAVAGKLEQQLKTAKKQTEKKQVNLSEQLKTTSQWQTLCNHLYTASAELNITKFSLMKRLLNTEISALKTVTSVVSDYKRKQASIDQLSALIKKSEAALQRLQLNTQQQETEWRERPEEINYETALAASQQQEQQLVEQLLAQLTLLGEKMPGKGKEDALFDRLTTRRQDYQGYAFRQKNLTEERESLITKITQCRIEMASCTEKLQHHNQQLQGEEIIGLHLALLEKKKLMTEQELIIAKQENELEGFKQCLQEKLQGTPFTDLHQLSAMLEQLQHLPKLEQHLTELEQEMDAKTITLEKCRRELEAETTEFTTKISQEHIDAQLKQVTEKLSIAHQETQRLEQLLKEQKQLQQKAEVVQAQLQSQKNIASMCSAEASQITEESGMDFRRRVQKRVTEQLLSQTNTVLEKVSGRYYLRQTPSEQGLALAIEDTFQGNVHRLPRTLSGGESFVISLALALGLSELANNGKSVDSLFLDEGFGNLDAETLYTVISTLEGLHTHGKTVGVISHIESVQKRFKAQLQVVKKPNGMGMLKQAS